MPARSAARKTSRYHVPNLERALAIMELLAAHPDSSAPSPQPPITQPDTLIEPLSERELELLRLIAAGMTNRSIADELMVSVNTVKTHARNIYGKLGVGNRTEATSRARDLALI